MTARLVLAALLLPLPALAHSGGGIAAGFTAGLAHPLGGLDHLAAMIAVGLWAGARGGTARFALPGAFLAAMLAGFGLAVAGVVLPGVEAGILASAIMLCMLAAIAAPLPLAPAVALTALFGLLHGHAHGTEGAATAAYAGGFLAATGALHAAGLLLALPLGPLARRARAWLLPVQYRL